MWSRIITGTNTSPGAVTGFQGHPAGQFSTRTHHTGLRAGVGIRVQMQATENHGAFTVNGSWSP